MCRSTNVCRRRLLRALTKRGLRDWQVCLCSQPSGAEVSRFSSGSGSRHLADCAGIALSLRPSCRGGQSLCVRWPTGSLLAYRFSVGVILTLARKIVNNSLCVMAIGVSGVNNKRTSSFMPPGRLAVDCRDARQGIEHRARRRGRRARHAERGPGPRVVSCRRCGWPHHLRACCERWADGERPFC